MNIDQFWEVVERVHASAPTDMELKCQSLEKELRRLPFDDLRSFDQHFRDLFFESYTWDVGVLRLSSAMAVAMTHLWISAQL